MEHKNAGVFKCRSVGVMQEFLMMGRYGPPYGGP